MDIINSPVLSRDFFMSIPPDIQNYLFSAEKISKQSKHNFISVEHMVAALLMDKNSIMRKFHQQMKFNWKKKVFDMLAKAHIPGAKPPWKSGVMVTPRMQDAWQDTINITKFKESLDVKESDLVWILVTMEGSFAYSWMRQENLVNTDFLDYMKQEYGFEDNSSVSVEPRVMEPDAAKPAAQPTPASGALGGLSVTDLFKKKDEPAPQVEEVVEMTPLFGEEAAVLTEEDFEPEPQATTILERDDEMIGSMQEDAAEIYTVSSDVLDETPSAQYDDSYSMETAYEIQEPPAEPVAAYEITSQPQSVEIEAPVSEKKDYHPDEKVNIADQFFYTAKELQQRNVPDSILSELLELTRTYKSLPERVSYNGRKHYFEEILNMKLDEAEFVKVIDGFRRSLDPSYKKPFIAVQPSAVAKSPFRSTLIDRPTEPRSLFKTEKSSLTKDSHTASSGTSSAVDGKHDRPISNAAALEKELLAIKDLGLKDFEPLVLKHYFSVETVEMAGLSDLEKRTGISEHFNLNDTLKDTKTYPFDSDMEVGPMSFIWCDIHGQSAGYVIKSAERTGQVKMDSSAVFLESSL